MKRLIAVSLVVLSSLSLIYIGCDSSDAPVDPGDGGEPSMVVGTVGASGGTLRSSDGRLEIAVPPGALSSDTEISAVEVDPASVAVAFGGFAGVRALSLRPSDLVLSTAVTVSYEFPISVRKPGAALSAASLSTGIEEPEDIVDVLVALAESRGDRLLVPPQEGAYNLDLANFKISLRLENFGDLMVGKPVKKDNPNAGDDFSYFGTGLRLGTTPYKDEEFELDVELWRGEYHAPIDAAQMTSIDPPTIDLEAGLADGDTVDSIIDELSGFRRHTMHPTYTPRVSGGLSVDFKLRFELDYQWDRTDLPDSVKAEDIGAIGVTIKYKKFDFTVDDCAKPPCQPPGGDFINIATGLNELRDLSVAYYDDVNDPPPGGASTQNGPRLFVTSDSMIQWYNLQRDGSGTITGTPRVGELGVIDSEGTIPVAQGSPGSRDRCMFMYGGTSGGWRTCWNDLKNDWGAIVMMAGNVTDASPFHGRANTNGWTWTNGSSVAFAEYDASTGLFLYDGADLIILSRFPDATGTPTTVAVGDDIESVIVVMDGSPAQVWWHDRADVFQDALLIGVAGNGAKQVRTANGIFAISNTASNDVTVGRWLPTVTIVGTHAVGAGPVGIDVVGLSGGGAAIVTTSETAGTYTLLTVDGQGNLTNTQTDVMPSGCAARYAIFVPGPKTYIAFSCDGTNNVTLVATSLSVVY